MPKINRTNAKGLVQETGKGAVGVPFVETVTLKLPTDGLRWRTDSDIGVTQPAGTVITAIHAIVTTKVDGNAAGTAGVRVGTAAGGEQIVALDADGLSAAANDYAVGIGVSTDEVLRVALQGAAALPVQAGSILYSDTERKIYPEMVRSANAAIAGEITFHIEFLGV